MQVIPRKTYKKSSKQNKKNKVVKENESGMLAHQIQNKRFPIISLPEIVTSHIIQEYRRFVATSSVSGFLTIYDLLNQFMMATLATLANSFIEAVRIKKIRLLSPVTTQGTSVTARLSPFAPDTSTNNFNGIPETYADTSASIDIPAYLSLTPSIMTPLGSWHRAQNTDSNLLTVQCPSGSTMDILFEYILPTSSTAQAYTRAIVGGTIGVLYTKNIITSFVPIVRAVI